MGVVTIPVPGHGDVDFDDSLTNEQIDAQIKALGVPQAAAAPAAAKPASAGPQRSVGDFLVNKLPASAGKAISGIAHAVGNPSETIKSILSIAGTPVTVPTYGIMSGLEDLGVMPKGTSSRFKEDKLKPALDFGANMSERYGGLFGGKDGWGLTPGKMAENIGNTLYEDPVGAAMDASMFTGAGSAALKARRGAVGSPTVAALNTPGPSLTERILGTTSKVTDPIALTAEGLKKAAGLAGKGLNATIRETIGKTTGAGGEALSEAYSVGKEKALDPNNFSAALADKRLVDAMGKARSPEETVALAKQGIQNMKDRASNEFVAAKENPTDGWMHDRTTLDFTGIRKAWADTYKTLFDPDTGIPIVSKGELNKINQIGELITDWESKPAGHTLSGLDNLKKAIRNTTRGLEETQVERVATRMANEVQGVSKAQSDVVYAGQPVNKYRSSMEKYETHMKDLDEMERSLSLGKRASIDTTARKLMSIMRDNVNTNFGQRIKNMEKLEEKGGIDLRPEIAGHALSSLAPRGLTGATDATALLAGIGGGAATGFGLPAIMTAIGLAPFTSPRVMGHTARALGKEAGLYGRYGDQYGIPQTLEGADKLLGHPGMLTGTLSNRTQPGQPGNEIVMPPITVRARGGALRQTSR
jgi:hypothetical protein